MVLKQDGFFVDLGATLRPTPPDGRREMLVKTRAAVFTALGWVLLFGGWARVVANDTVPTWPMALTPVLVGAAAALLTAGWIRHNVSLHRRLGARRAVAATTSPYRRDQLGRRVLGGRAPAAWHQVCVSATSRQKRYVVVD